MSDFTMAGGVQLYKGIPTFPIVFKNQDGTPPVQFGSDAGGNPVFFTILSAQETVAATAKNETSLPQTLTYTATTGSEYGFSQSASISVEVSGGIDLGPINFGTNVNVTGTLGFSQAFSKSVAHSAAVTVSPGKTGIVYEAVLMVQYLVLIPMTGPNGTIFAYIWGIKQKDIINTGNYILRES
jgi:hypothetical protein